MGVTCGAAIDDAKKKELWRDADAWEARLVERKDASYACLLREKPARRAFVEHTPEH